jgi:hypothetical protein
LGCATEQVESVTGGQPLAFHQNALGLPDDIARAQSPVQRGFAIVDLVAAVRHRHAHSQVRGQDRAELLVLIAESIRRRAVEAERAER